MIKGRPHAISVSLICAAISYTRCLGETPSSWRIARQSARFVHVERASTYKARKTFAA